MKLPWRALAPIAVAALLALLPAPAGLAPHAWLFFAIFAVAPLVSKTPEGSVSLPYLPGIITFFNTGVYFLQA